MPYGPPPPAPVFLPQAAASLPSRKRSRPPPGASSTASVSDGADSSSVSEAKKIAMDDASVTAAARQIAALAAVSPGAPEAEGTEGLVTSDDVFVTVPLKKAAVRAAVAEQESVRQAAKRDVDVGLTEVKLKEVELKDLLPVDEAIDRESAKEDGEASDGGQTSSQTGDQSELQDAGTIPKIGFGSKTRSVWPKPACLLPKAERNGSNGVGEKVNSSVDGPSRAVDRIPSMSTIGATTASSSVLLPGPAAVRMPVSMSIPVAAAVPVGSNPILPQQVPWQPPAATMQFSSLKNVNEFQCVICNVRCNSTDTYNSHLGSAKHKRKMMFQACTQTSTAVAPVPAAPLHSNRAVSLPSASAAPQPPACIPADSKFSCDVCLISCCGADNFQAHLRGKQHAKRLRANAAVEQAADSQNG